MLGLALALLMILVLFTVPVDKIVTKKGVEMEKHFYGWRMIASYPREWVSGETTIYYEMNLPILALKVVLLAIAGASIGGYLRRNSQSGRLY